MATLAPGGRITTQVVEEEIDRLTTAWYPVHPKSNDSILDEVMGAAAEKLDRFQRVQLIDVLSVCRQSKNISEAGRKLFAVSRQRKRNPNDADRLRKYLNKYNIRWEAI
jgi:transcriptional regulatory protein RtcR